MIKVKIDMPPSAEDNWPFTYHNWNGAVGTLINLENGFATVRGDGDTATCRLPAEFVRSIEEELS